MPWQKPWRGAASWPAQPAFLQNPEPPTQGQQSLIKKPPTGLLTQFGLMESFFLIEVPSSQLTLAGVKLTYLFW